MHFVTGGAFNGKRKWVKAFYQLNEKNDYVWISAYEKNGAQMEWKAVDSFKTTTVIEGVEQFLYKWSNQTNWREKWHDVFKSWEKWELENPMRKLVVIGTDITKGVVPLDERNRNWRDMTGWCYQDLVSHSKRVDVIWYGINERLK